MFHFFISFLYLFFFFVVVVFFWQKFEKNHIIFTGFSYILTFFPLYFYVFFYKFFVIFSLLYFGLLFLQSFLLLFISLRWIRQLWNERLTPCVEESVRQRTAAATETQRATLIKTTLKTVFDQSIRAGCPVELRI